MASGSKNQSQAQHLASLDFDISGIIETLQKVDELTKSSAVQAGKNFSESFKSGIESVQQATTVNTDIIDSKSVSNAKEQVKELSSAYGELAKTVQTLNASGEQTRTTKTFIDENDIQTVVRYKSTIEATGATITTNYAKQQSESKKIQSQIESLIQKQSKLNTTINAQKSSEQNQKTLKSNKELISSLTSLNEKVKSGSITLKDARDELEKYTSRAKELGTEYEQTGLKGESFLKKISDKAKWLGAFYIVNELRQALVNVFSTIKETEDAVVSLQRVLNDDSISNSAIQEELYDIATQYGRTFDEVSSVAQQFVQAGNDWQDSVELTKGTMLALNTAELDVTQSTEGLIAIMAQWNLEAEDYADVIDKINITADNFSVTSEKIVAALQRSSSSAKNANISLEETIGIITALAEATGRSGENIGTALNSLIVYTSKSSALETFAEVGSDAMKKVVQDYQQGAVSIYEVWKQLSKEVSNLSAQQQQILFESADYQELAATLETELKDVYGAAGTYRQNYFIALLNDLSTAEEAVKEMAGAEGYSLRENERYMESLTASLNQLKAVVAELAVQFGEAGFLELTKFIVRLSTNVLELTKNMGGLSTVIGLVGSGFLVFYQNKLDTSIHKIAKGFLGLYDNVVNYVSAIVQAEGATNKFKAATSALTKNINTSIGVYGAATAALTALYAIYKFVIEKQEEAREKRIEENESALELSEGIENLISRYNSLSQISTRTISEDEELEQVNSELVKILGDRAKALNNLTEKTRDYTQALNEATEEELKSRRVNLQNLMDDYAQAFTSSVGSVFSFKNNSANIIASYLSSDSEEIQKIIDKNLSSFKQYSIGADKWFYGPLDSSAKSLAEYYSALKAASDELEEFGGQSQQLSEFVSQSKAYKTITESVTSMSSAFNDYLEAVVNYQINEALLLTGIPQTAKEFDNFKKNVIAATGASEDFNVQIEKLIDDKFPSLSGAAEEASNSISDSFASFSSGIKSVTENIDGLNEEIDSFQSGFDTIISAMQEYNENGYLTVDTIQAIVSAGGEYLSLLQFTADGITLNEEKVREFINTQSNNVDALLASAYASDVLRISEKYLGESLADTGVQADNAILKISGLNPELANLIQKAWNGGDAAFHLAEGLAAVAGTTVSGVDMKAYQSELDQARQNWKSIGDEIRTSIGNASTWSNTAASAAKSSSQSQTNALKEQLEAQKEAIKNRYDAEIEALKEVEEENDRIRKEEEYYRNRQEALQDIEKAATRSGVEYREQEAEARQKLEELDREWQETVKDWSIEDQIETLEKLRDAEIAAIDTQIDSIKSGAGAVTNEIAKNAVNLNQTMLDSYQSDYLEPQLDLTKKTAEKLLDVYEYSFISPLKSHLIEVQQQLSNIGVSVPIPPYSPYLHDRLQYQSSVNTTNNQTANVFANVLGQSSANSLVNRIFRKP